MALVFDGIDGSNNRGRVVVLPESRDVSGSILQVENWGGFNLFKSIFTRVTIAEGTNHQFLHGLGDRIYLYVFGNRIGQISLSGISFFEICGSGSGTTQIGITMVRDFFRRNRLSNRAAPLRITLDPTTVFEAYLHTFQADAVSTASTTQRLYQFNLTASLIPDDAAAEGN
jgi:hypothetical protein